METCCLKCFIIVNFQKSYYMATLYLVIEGINVLLPAVSVHDQSSQLTQIATDKGKSLSEVLRDISLFDVCVSASFGLMTHDN